VVAIELMFLISNSLKMTELAGFRMQLIVIGSACGIMTIYVLRILPADFIRLFVGSLVKSVYRIKTTGLENIPKSGGALLLPNHVTFADAFFLSVVSDRPVRFVMDETFMANPTIRLSAKLFGTVTIRRSHPLEAIRTTIEALSNGDLVVLFPEGQLTRTGGLCELERGFEIIAKNAQVPILPVWVDGSWGSIFSFSGGRYFTKWPRRFRVPITVSFSKPLTPEEAKHILGGQANLWTEYIPSARKAQYMMFPRASAMSEVLWSPKASRDWAGFQARLPFHLDRLTQAGVNFRKLDAGR
jgi:1-acyl-sn-glycerol-3-phosphate acyltransferase